MAPQSEGGRLVQLFYQFMFGLCVLCLVFLRVSLRAMHGAGRLEECRLLRRMVLGAGLTALSFLFRALDPPRPGHVPLLGFLASVGGAIVFGRVWAGWGRLRRKPSPTRARHEDAARPDEPHFSLGVRHALHDAEQEAWRRGLPQVDTEHLLLGVLRGRQCQAVRVLIKLGVSPAQVRSALAERLGPHVREDSTLGVAGKGALAGRACDVLDLASQEAHRFDSPCISTGHLLLGLLLRGDGLAAHVLFQEGLTVDRTRQTVMAERTPSGGAGQARPRGQETF